MAIVIKPKNLFGRDLSRQNDNTITSASMGKCVLTKNKVQVYNESLSFFYEALVSNKYKYYPYKTKLENDGFVFIEEYHPSGVGDDYTYDIIYKEIEYDVGENLLDISAFNSVSSAATSSSRSYSGESSIKVTEETNVEATRQQFEETFYDPVLDHYYGIIPSTTANIINAIKSLATGNSIDSLGGGIVIDTTRTTGNKIVFYIVYRILKYILNDGVKSDLTYTLSGNYSWSVDMYSATQEEPQNSAYKLDSNELIQENTRLYYYPNNRERNIVVAHREYISGTQWEYKFWVTTPQNVASNLTVTLEIREGPMPTYVTLTIPNGSRTSQEYSREFLSTSPLYSVSAVSPLYDNTYCYKRLQISIGEYLSGKVVDNYSNGKQTAVLECSIDDYYDENNTKAISKCGENDLLATFKNNDIVYPKRVKMAKDASGNYNQQEVDFSEGKKFRVVGVRVKYDGCVMQELTLQEEKTQ